METAKTIDEYILQSPEDVRPKLRELRKLIQETLPEATEKMSWKMPTFYLLGNVVHFAVYAKHIGFYPGGAAMQHFLPRLSGYKTSKGALQLPLDKPFPEDLLREMVLYSANENKVPKTQCGKA